MSIFIRKQAYTGPVKAVVLDWAGTAVDYGSIGPAAVFVDVFAKFGVAVSLAEVRQFMGVAKKDHIRNICSLPSVIAQWQQKNDRSPDETDVESIYAETEPMMVETIPRHADLIPGLLETVDSLRRQGVKIGSSTGYTAPMMAALVPAAIAHVWFFGPGLIFNLLVASIFALGGEYAVMRLRNRPPEVALTDYSALVAAALLVFALPPLTLTADVSSSASVTAALLSGEPATASE